MTRVGFATDFDLPLHLNEKGQYYFWVFRGNRKLIMSLKRENDHVEFLC